MNAKTNYRVASWPGQADVGPVEVEVKVVRPSLLQLRLEVVPGAKGVVEIFAPGSNLGFVASLRMTSRMQ